MQKNLKIAVGLGAVGLVILLLVPSAFTMMITTILGGGEEEEGGDGTTTVYVSMLLSDEVEAYRDQVLEQAKKEDMESYIELFLAVMMQESGGTGNDVFQASESKGLEPNTLSVEESIKQGVKYLSSMLKRASCTGPTDEEHIRLALQGYNFGGAYIDYALEKSGKWTQKNTFAYAKKKSGGKRNTGTRKEALGPWRYGDQYYTDHVLRYYDASETDGSTAAFGIALNKRMKWLFPNGTPTDAVQMQSYLIQIEVPYYTGKKKKKYSTMTLTVHKKLASEIQAAFEEMKKAKFPIDPEHTAGYAWRMMASNPGKISHHSYGCVVDINWTHNGASYTSWPYKPGKDKYAVTKKIVKIWKKHGFYWGGDWSGNYCDPMHFTYTNH